MRANKIYIYNNFQSAVVVAGATLLVLGLDFENHCPKAFLILEARELHGFCTKGAQEYGRGDRGSSCPPAALLLIRISQALRSPRSFVSMPLSKQVQSSVQGTLGVN